MAAIAESPLGAAIILVKVQVFSRDVSSSLLCKQPWIRRFGLSSGLVIIGREQPITR